jgi:hypothetical protein
MSQSHEWIHPRRAGIQADNSATTTRIHNGENSYSAEALAVRAPPGFGGTTNVTAAGSSTTNLHPHDSSLLQAHYGSDRPGQPLPMGRLALKMAPSKPRQSVKFRAPPQFTRLPFGGNPPLLLKLVQRRVKRAVTHPQNIAGDLIQTLADRPPMHRLQRQYLQQQQIQRSLNEIGRFTHASMSSLTDNNIHRPR